MQHVADAQRSVAMLSAWHLQTQLHLHCAAVQLFGRLTICMLKDVGHCHGMIHLDAFDSLPNGWMVAANQTVKAIEIRLIQYKAVTWCKF